jgi:hypothetical protein
VKPTALYIFCVLGLISAPLAFAQYHGGGGHRNGGGVSGPTPDTSNSDIRGLQRAMAVQATPDQIVQFRQLNDSTQSARRRLQELLKLPASTPKPDWVHNTYPMTSDVEEALAENERFLQSFTKEQKDGLKKFSKQLLKADSAITNDNKKLSRDLESDAVGGAQIAGTIERLKKALDDFQSQQLAIAAEMGIQSQAKSE